MRSQERAELAAHLHDSVLQTLALMQRRAENPREVAGLARRQERELRAWLNGGRPLRRARHARGGARARRGRGGGEPRRRRSTSSTVGDCPLDAGARGARRRRRARRSSTPPSSPGREPVSVYAEVGEERVEVFVRDRGPGFDPDAVPEDRRGVRESIVGPHAPPRRRRRRAHRRRAPAPRSSCGSSGRDDRTGPERRHRRRPPAVPLRRARRARRARRGARRRRQRRGRRPLHRRAASPTSCCSTSRCRAAAACR